MAQDVGSTVAGDASGTGHGRPAACCEEDAAPRASESQHDTRQIRKPLHSRLRILLGLLVSLVCLVLVLRGVQWDAVAVILGNVRLAFLMAAVAVELAVTHRCCVE